MKEFYAIKGTKWELAMNRQENGEHSPIVRHWEGSWNDKGNKEYFNFAVFLDGKLILDEDSNFRPDEFAEILESEWNGKKEIDLVPFEEWEECFKALI